MGAANHATATTNTSETRTAPGSPFFIPETTAVIVTPNNSTKIAMFRIRLKALYSRHQGSPTFRSYDGATRGEPAAQPMMP
jgi:hypothetical protein